MPDWLMAIVAVLIYVFVMRVVLPRAGVPT